MFQYRTRHAYQTMSEIPRGRSDCKLCCVRRQDIILRGMNYEGDRLSALCYGKAINPAKIRDSSWSTVVVRNTSLPFGT